MKKTMFLLLTLFLLIPTITNAEYKFAENWTWTDTAYQGTFLLITTVDWVQTHWMAERDWYWDDHQHYEMNPFLGRYPSTGTVDKLIPLGMAVHTVIALAIPPRSISVEEERKGKRNWNFRRIWQCTFVIVEAAAVGNNYAAGVRFDF